MIGEAEDAGAAVLRPGRVRAEDEGSGGYFVSPALVVAPPPRSSIVRQEQFAPALPVIPYDDVWEAVAAANDTEFGLCASVWTNDDALAADVAARLSAGTVFVNTHGLSSIDMYAPMGGWKQSGFGVELGPEGMQAFARQRVIVVRPGPADQGAQSTEVGA
jgi:acyl-CoA reductase-like NAD-dependent aldehyde dehydrogenase